MQNIREEEKENSSSSSLVTESIGMESSSDPEFEILKGNSNKKRKSSEPSNVPMHAHLSTIPIETNGTKMKTFFRPSFHAKSHLNAQGPEGSEIIRKNDSH